VVAGLAWLAFILRLDAVICPFGSGLIYSTTTSRISFALARNGYVPDQFQKTSQRRVPVFGVLFATAIGLLFLLGTGAEEQAP
jgi:amino acid transporter